MSAQELKDAGNKAFQASKFDEAIDLFSKAIAVEDNYVFFSNRSGAHASKKDWSAALDDAEECIKRNPSWPKGYSRKGTALMGMGSLAEAKAAYEDGLKRDPDNAALKEALEEVNARAAAPPARGPAAGGLGNLFNVAKLAANPKTAAYLQDPSFMRMMRDMQSNPSAMSQYMSDPRLMEALSVSLGMDLSKGPGAMGDEDLDADADADAFGLGGKQQQQQQQQQRAGGAYAADESDDSGDEKPAAATRANVPAAARAPAQPRYSAPAPAPAPTAAEAEEEEVDEELEAEKRERAAQRAKADALKEEGTKAYKNKDFANARRLYTEAFETDGTNAAYLSNLAAVAVEEKQWAEAVTLCDQALAVAATHRIDSAQKGRIYLRKANALVKQDKYPEAIEAYKRSILEENTQAARDALRKTEAAKKAYDYQQYLDPVKSEEEKEAGNKLFQAADYPAAIGKYTEALRRNPDNYKVYANRAACYIKMMDWGKGLDDCNKCLGFDPTFVKAYVRKGRIEHFLKRYPQAIDTYKQGLQYEPTNEDLLDGLRQTHAAIAEANRSGEVDPQRREESMRDPEVQRIMRDPLMNQILQDLQDNPEKAQSHLKDPKVMQAIEKLAAAGIIRLG